eukprot:7475041-Pyramimonas_sp.AAC.1
MAPRRAKRPPRRPKRLPRAVLRRAEEPKIVKFQWENVHFHHVRLVGLYGVEDGPRAHQHRPKTAQEAPKKR